MPKNTPMRRKDRLVTNEKWIRLMLSSQEVLHLGLYDDDRIYVVPVNYSYTLEGGKLTLYFHGAQAGLKHDILARRPAVGFCIDGDAMVIPSEQSASAFTSHYKSLIGSGRAIEIEDLSEKKEIFAQFMKHYSNRAWDIPDAALAHTALYRLEAEEFQVKMNPAK